MIVRSEPGYFQTTYILLQYCIFQLTYRTTFRTNQMQMCFGKHLQLVLNRLGHQLMANNQAAIFQHFERIVKRCPADMKIDFFQFLMELTHIEMAGEVANTFQDCIPFLSLP